MERDARSTACPPMALGDGNDQAETSDMKMKLDEAVSLAHYLSEQKWLMKSRLRWIEENDPAKETAELTKHIAYLALWEEAIRQVSIAD
jgi:hypothetical protein